MKQKERTSSKKQIKKKQKPKVSAYDRLSGEIEDVMFEIAGAADKLHDLLPRFKRLSVERRQSLYDFIYEAIDRLDLVVGWYWYTLPEELREPEDFKPDTDLGSALLGAGILGLIMRLTRDRKCPDDPEWPDSIDIEGGKAERRPKQLNPGESG